MSGPKRSAHPWRRLTFALMMVWLTVILAPEAEALEVPPERLTTAVCPTLTAPSWTDTEQWVWRRLCAGDPADLNSHPSLGGELDPSMPTGWIYRRKLSPEFLRAILFDKPFQDALPSSGVRIAGALFTRKINLSDGVLVRPVMIHKSRFEKNLILRRIKTEHYFSLQSSFVEADLDLSYSTFEQVALGGGSFGRLIMAATTVRNQLVLEGTHVRGRTNLFSLRSYLGVFLHEGVFDGWLKMERVVINADLYLRGVTVKHVDLSNAVIEGTLWIGPNKRDKRETLIHWTDAQSQLILRDTRVGFLTTTTKPGVWPPLLDLNGFKYTRLSCPPDQEPCSDTQKSDFLAEPVEWFLEWLSRSPFSPQPYEQLSEVLKVNGFPEKARRVLYEGKNQKWRNSRINSVATAIDFVLLTLSWLFIGFGYRLYYVGIWILAFLFVGAFVFSRTPEAKQQRINWGIAYSFDALIPLITLRKKHEEIDIDGPARYYFYFHRIMGYVLAFFVIAGLSGLTK